MAPQQYNKIACRRHGRRKRLNIMKVAFVHIPKTAGGSIKTWLATNQEKYNFQYQTHPSAHVFLQDMSLPFDFSFTCVRNTYDRMISLYEWTKYKIGKKVCKKQRRNEVIEEDDLRVNGALEKGINYYLPWICENTGYSYLMESQLVWIKDVDYIINTENLKEEFKIIQNKLNCHEALTQTVHKLNYDPAQYYSKEFVSIVERLYSEEIQYFNYKPNKKYYRG